MQEIKDFAVYALKSQILWGVVIVWLVTNIRWLFPQVPPEVLNSFTDLVTAIGIVVVAFLGGKEIEKKKVARYMARLAPTPKDVLYE